MRSSPAAPYLGLRITPPPSQTSARPINRQPGGRADDTDVSVATSGSVPALFGAHGRRQPRSSGKQDDYFKLYRSTREASRSEAARAVRWRRGLGRERLVRQASVRDGEGLQDQRGELSDRRASAGPARVTRRAPRP